MKCKGCDETRNTKYRDERPGGQYHRSKALLEQQSRSRRKYVFRKESDESEDVFTADERVRVNNLKIVHPTSQL